MTYYVSHAFAHNLLSFYKIKVGWWINVIIASLAVFPSIFQTKHLHCNTRRRWTWTGDFKCREVKTGFYRNRSMQTGSSGTLIGWKSSQTTFVPLWDWMEGAGLRTRGSANLHMSLPIEKKVLHYIIFIFLSISCLLEQYKILTSYLICLLEPGIFWFWS